jgi:hypothetical protein
MTEVPVEVEGAVENGKAAPFDEAFGFWLIGYGGLSSTHAQGDER